MLGVRILSDLQLHAEPIDQQFDQRLIFDLKLNALIQHLFDKDLQFYPGAILAVDELLNNSVELKRVVVEFDIKVSELVEDELLPLPVFEEEQGNQVLRGELDELLGGVTSAVVGALLAEVVLEHELMHGCVKGHSFAGLTG